METCVLKSCVKCLMRITVAVQHLVDRVAINRSENHRKIKDRNFRNKAYDGSYLAAYHVDVTGLHLTQNIGIISQITIYVRINGKFSSGNLTNLLGKQQIKLRSCSTLRRRISKNQFYRFQICISIRVILCFGRIRSGCRSLRCCAASCRCCCASGIGTSTGGHRYNHRSCHHHTDYFFLHSFVPPKIYVISVLTLCEGFSFYRFCCSF